MDTPVHVSLKLYPIDFPYFYVLDHIVLVWDLNQKYPRNPIEENRLSYGIDMYVTIPYQIYGGLELA